MVIASTRPFNLILSAAAGRSILLTHAQVINYMGMANQPS